MIVQVGPYPPPAGGISVTVQRMKERLDAAGLANEVWDTSEAPKRLPGVKSVPMPRLPLFLLARHDVQLLHYHVTGAGSRLRIALYNRLLSRGSVKMMTLHGQAAHLLAAVERRRMVRALNTFGLIICVKSGDGPVLREAGVTAEIVEIPAFVPLSLREDDWQRVPQAAREFLTGHEPVLAAMSSGLRFHEGVDLYGADLCLDLCERLRNDYPRVGLIFCLPQIGDSQYLQQLKRRRDEMGLAGHLLFVEQDLPFAAVLTRSRVYLRPTNTDGDSVAVREALQLGVPVVASDVVPRPAGTILFANRDPADLAAKVSAVLSEPRRGGSGPASGPALDGGRAVLDLYARLLAGRRG